jgi:hypothetical protein
MVTDEGSWPNDRNVAHAFRETTLAQNLGVVPVFPRGGERFKAGSVQFIDWWGEAVTPESTRVRLELSTQGAGGPWELVAESLRNAGRYQWRTPLSAESDSCYIRYTVTSPSDSAVGRTRRAFSIRGVVGTSECPGLHVSALQLAPNPARMLAFVQLERYAAERGVVSAFGSDGRAVWTGRPGTSDGRVLLPVATWPAGSYFVVVQTGGTAWVGKLVVRH